MAWKLKLKIIAQECSKNSLVTFIKILQNRNFFFSNLYTRFLFLKTNTKYFLQNLISRLSNLNVYSG